MASTGEAHPPPPCLFRRWTYSEAWQDQRKAAQTAQHRCTTDPHLPVDHAQCIQALAWSRDEHSLLLWACTRNGLLCAWRVPKASDEGDPPHQSFPLVPVWQYSFSTVPLRGLTIAPKTQRLVLAGSKGVWVCDKPSNISMTAPPTPSKDLSDKVVPPPPPIRLATHPYAWHAPLVTDLCVAGPQEDTVWGLAQQDDFGIYQWQISNQSILHTVPSSQPGVRTTTMDYCQPAAIHNSDPLLCDGDSQGRVHVRNAPSGTIKATMPVAQKDPVQFVRFVSQQWIVAAYPESSTAPTSHGNRQRPTSQLVAWHLATESEVARTTIPAKIQSILVVNNATVWVGTNDGHVSVLTAPDLKLQRRMAVAATPSVHAVAVSDSHIAVAGVGRLVEVWDADFLPCLRLSLP